MVNRIGAGDDIGILVVRNGRVVTLLTLTIHGGLVDHIHALADPAKLAPLSAALGS